MHASRRIGRWRGTYRGGRSRHAGRHDRRPGGPGRNTGRGGRRKRGGTHCQRPIRFHRGHDARCSTATACSPVSTAKWQLRHTSDRFEQCDQCEQSRYGRPPDGSKRVRRGRSGSRHGLPSSRSISTPYAAQAAFNSHSAKAQPLPPDSPLARKLA